MSIPNTVRRVFVGFDSRELAAYKVAVHSLLAHSSVPVAVIPLILDRLELLGIMYRPRERLKKGRSLLVTDKGVRRRITTAAESGQLWDLVSDAPMSTEFACSRFAVQILAQTGWVVFADSDVVFDGDIAELFALADERYAVMVVKHGDGGGDRAFKMDGQIQTAYPRKNWSSVMLWNCDHPANLGLTLTELNARPGRWLHGFGWLHDSLIGELPPAWNWLVGVSPRPDGWKVAHFTLGGPWLEQWTGSEHDAIWLAAEANLAASSG